MDTLFIIGNGFDLWHNLPTSYSNFYRHSKEVLDELESYYQIDINDDCPWRDFENVLGTYDWRMMYDRFDFTEPMSDSFKVSETYGLEDELSQQTDDLMRAIEDGFRDWICEIDVESANKKMTFPENAIFLTFNYTSTLQTVYKIDDKRILHIHGRADDHTSLVFGHGEKIVEMPEQDENGDSNRTIFTDAENAAKSPFRSFRKPVEKIIARNESYFEGLRGIREIVIIGLSLSGIDLPYIETIARHATTCQWTVYCHSDSAVPRSKSQLAKCGVTECQINTRGYEEPLFWPMGTL
jgi:hypothetical protein